jgi:hypothetical protein
LIVRHQQSLHTAKYPINSLFHLFRDLLVDGIAEILNGAFSLTQDYWGCVVRSSLTRLGVDTDEVEVFPHSLNQLIDVEPFL